MKTGKTMDELVRSVLEQNMQKRDFRSPARSIRMEAEEGDFHIHLDNGEDFHPLPIAHQQIGSKLNIPKVYYDRMMEEAPELLADNVNTWFGKSDSSHLVRTIGDDMRALLSDRYRPLDNFDLLGQSIIPVINPIMEHMHLASAELTEKRMYIKMVNTRLEGEVKKGDPVQAGIIISNSEVGMGSVQIQPLIFRLVCLNGAIMSDSSIRKYHIGGRITEGEEAEMFYTDSTRLLADKAFFSQVQDVMRGVMEEEGFYKIIQRLQIAASNEIGKKPIQDVVEVTAKKYGLGKNESEEIIKNFIQGNDLTQWGLGNAVTQYSQAEEVSYDRATELERIGGQIFDMPKSSWHEIAA